MRKGYIKDSNTPAEVWQTVTHPDNLAAHVVKDGQGNVIGYQVVRMKLDDNQTPFVNLRRLHVSLNSHGQGVGSELMKLAEEIAACSGAKYLQVPASGGSEAYFTKIGYQRLPDDNPLGSINPELKQRGVETPLIQMVKPL